jgi:hypothetical protein
MGDPYFRPSGKACIKSAITNFFGLQYWMALHKKRTPVFAVDHPLDAHIPFTPEKVKVYLNFTHFWVQLLGSLLHCYGRAVYAPVKNFVATIGNLYQYATAVYKQALSTTKRPWYFRKLRFIPIHLLDPHLFCIPSLHVMIVISTYTQFRVIARQLNDEERLSGDIAAVYAGAVAITESVLYIKQHSINCIAAAMYAMSRFNEELFPREEALRFAGDLFAGGDLPDTDRDAIVTHIIQLYTQFCRDGHSAPNWEQPLLDFLHTFPPVIPGIRNEKKRVHK